MTTFKELGLNNEIMKGLDDLEFVEPSTVQAKTIPFILKSKQDLIALAQTGTGKTAAFSLPILNQIKEGERALQTIILCPTRELSLQIFQDIKKFSKYSKGIKVTAVYGGERIDLQIRALKSGTNIVVGTPGRVKDLIKRKILKLQNIKWVVLDEADEMLDMGFKDDLDTILDETPKEKQTLLFSATMSKNVRLIAKNYMTNAEEISIGTKNIGAENVSHEYYVVQARERFESLKRILDYLPGVYGILFCRTRRETQEIADKLKQANYDTEAIHGDIAQNMRTKIMDRFKKKHVRLLVATDVAARGIDVSDLSHVINYSLPDQNEAYTHRSGRTGRAKKSGVSISLVSLRDLRTIRSLESILGKKFEHKQIPSGKEVIQKRIDNFIKEMEETTFEDSGNEKYFSELTEKLKKINKEELIKYFVTDKFSYFIDNYKNAPDLNISVKAPKARMESGDGVNLKINFGKKHGLDVKGVFALINSKKSLKGVEVGQISLMQDSSIFSVDKKRADDVVSQLNGANFRGKKISVSRSSGQVSSFSGGGSGSRSKSRGRRAPRTGRAPMRRRR